MVLGSLNEEMSQLDIAPPNNSAAEGSEAALSQSSKPSHTCAYCDKPATHWMCGGCSIDPYNPAHAATCYCSQICMLADRTQHKRACIQIQQRLHVHRAGFILHKIFFYWRMINFDNPIHAIEEKDDKLLVHVTDLKHIAHDSLISYVPFPDTNIVTVADALAVACVSACNDATFCLRDMLSTLMTGSCYSIQEFDIRLTQIPHLTQIVWPKSEKYPEGQLMNEHHVHSVMVVSLSQHDHADSYVIDLSGAQFGIERPVTPYTEYMEDYGVVIDRIRPVGSYQIDERETEEEKERGGVAINEANKLQKLTLKVAMTGWDAGPENTKISQMLKLPRSKFAEQSEAFIERMGAMLLYGFDSLHESAGALKKFGEYSFPSDWEAHVAAHNKLFGGQQGIKQGQY